MKKRYQVFVSSTFQDLQEERKEIMQALLELDCIPAGMELFPAANEDQWTLIKKVIDDCDYYLVVIGGRYGSIGPDGTSYTEMEYRYALEQSKPMMAFVHQDPETLPANRSEPTPEGRAKLENFRALVQKKMVRFWKSAPDLGSVVSRSLYKLILTVPATGWIRADELGTKDSFVQDSIPEKGKKNEFPGESRWGNTGSLYWLGHDLMWTVAELLHRGDREAVSNGLRRAHHHLCEIGMSESPYAGYLTRWLKEVEKVSQEDWTTKRRQLAAAVDRLTDQVGAIAENYQGAFRASPED